tara:strand:+ start:2442 stop:4478 length:2037 start_codon:yes stop_codon:yes gene_type:complete
MLAKITLDFETRSEADLRKVGAWAYSEDPTTEVVCLAWGIGTEDILTWTPLLPEASRDPLDKLFALIEQGHPVEAHNVAFEFSVWRNVCEPRYGFPPVPEDQWEDTMATAAYYAMPMALDRLARALRYESKDPEGGRLISKYSKLNLKTAKRDIPLEDLEKFIAYCVKDVEIEQSMSDYLGPLPERELPYFQLDQTINRRGIFLDIEGIKAATHVVDARSEELAEEFRALTGLSPTQRDKVMQWVQDQGVELLDLTADTIDETLEADDSLREALAAGERLNTAPLSAAVRRALEVRREISKASTKKLDAMARQRGRDGRARYQTRYHGAVTGRNTGAGFQPLNLTRNWEDVDPEQLVRDIRYGDPRWLDVVYGDAMEAVSKASRHWIMAAEGNRILAADFTSVEAIILACLAGEEWKVQAFKRKEKIYERTADKIYKLPTGTVTKATHPAERQDGKTCELAFGYQGALGAWLKFDKSGRHSDEAIIEMCKSWRAEHGMIVNLWYGLNDAAIEAVSYGREVGYRDIGFEMVDEWLTMILPNGKRLWYFDPMIKWGMPRWHDPKEKEDCAAGTCSCREQPRLTYMAQKEGQWKRVSTYGGKLTENATQATSREVLMPAMLAAERRGYPIVLTVYDEIVAEVPEGQGSLKEFIEIMTQPYEKWYADWPISADGWEGKRYKK